jgi:regulator of Ty1 transposition protein 103
MTAGNFHIQLMTPGSGATTVIAGWAVKHTLRNTGDDKVTRSCTKLVNVWQERKIFGSRSLEGWLDGGGGDDAAAAAAAAGGGGGGGSGGGGSGGGGGGGGSGGGARQPPKPAVARRREERLAEVPAALTGQNAALAKSLEAAEAAAAKLAKAEELCAADLRPEVGLYKLNAADP